MIDRLLQLVALGFQRLPEPAALRLGRRLGLLWHDAIGYRRGVARAGLRQAFPELSERDRRRLCRGSFAHYGTVLAEFLRLPTLADGGLLARTEVTGLEHVAAARDRGRGLIVLTAHVGNWEWLAAAQAALGLDIAIITRHAHQRGVDRYWQRTRQARGLRFFDNHGSLHAVMRHLREGGAVGMSIDQNEGGTTGARVPFFGRESGTVKAPALLSARLGCPVLMALSWRDESGRHHADFSPEIAPVAGVDLADTVERTTRHYNALLEAFIREHPTQWTWVHRRWKPA
ncbi:MAG: lysophospholipid acyltransferase family protein [Candidatus Krumholzibacteriia bacterium]